MDYFKVLISANTETYIEMLLLILNVRMLVYFKH